MTSLIESTNPVFAAQSTFRAVMNAMSRPGSVHKLAFSGDAPAPLMRASTAIAIALFDQDTPVWLDDPMARTNDVTNWLSFKTGAATTTDCEQAHFALIGDAAAAPAFTRFAQGTGDYPDRSTTLILQVTSLSDGPTYELRGPGINGSAVVHAALQPVNLPERLAENNALFPLGVDVILVADDSVIALPRTTRLTVRGD